MRPRDWFSVGIRLFGLWVFYRGYTSLLIFLADRLGWLSRSSASRELSEASNRGELLFYAFGEIGLALLMLFWSEQITRWSFHEPSPVDDSPAEPE